MATDDGSINKYLREARRRDLTVLPPDINRSERKFVIDGDAIRYGLDSVRDVGEKGCAAILAHRPYANLEDYLARAGAAGTNKTTVTNLILIGAFDSLGPRTEILKQLERYRAMEGLAQSTLGNPEKLEAAIARRLASGHYGIEAPDFTNPDIVYAIEKYLVGTYVTVDPLGRYISALDGTAIRDPLDMLSIPYGDKFVVGGQLTAIRPTVTKKGRTPGAEMASISVMWNEAEFRVVCFPESWAACKAMLTIDKVTGVGPPVALQVKKLDSGCCLEKMHRLDTLFDEEGIA